MKHLGVKTKEVVSTARPVRIHKGNFRNQKSYDLLNVMDLIYYINWMHNPDNEHNCESCRDNCVVEKLFLVETSTAGCLVISGECNSEREI